MGFIYFLRQIECINTSLFIEEDQNILFKKVVCILERLIQPGVRQYKYTKRMHSTLHLHLLDGLDLETQLWSQLVYQQSVSQSYQTQLYSLLRIFLGHFHHAKASLQWHQVRFQPLHKNVQIISSASSVRTMSGFNMTVQQDIYISLPSLQQEWQDQVHMDRQ